MHPSEKSTASPETETDEDQSVGSLVNRLLRRLDQMGDRQSHDAWAIESLSEKVDGLAAGAPAPAQTQAPQPPASAATPQNAQPQTAQPQTAQPHSAQRQPGQPHPPAQSPQPAARTAAVRVRRRAQSSHSAEPDAAAASRPQPNAAMAPDAVAAAIDRLDQRIDAIHFAIGATPKALSMLTDRLDALQAAVEKGQAGASAPGQTASVEETIDAAAERLASQVDAVLAQRMGAVQSGLTALDQQVAQKIDKVAAATDEALGKQALQLSEAARAAAQSSERLAQWAAKIDGRTADVDQRVQTVVKAALADAERQFQAQLRDALDARFDARLHARLEAVRADTAERIEAAARRVSDTLAAQSAEPPSAEAEAALETERRDFIAALEQAIGDRVSGELSAAKAAQAEVAADLSGKLAALAESQAPAVDLEALKTALAESVQSSLAESAAAAIDPRVASVADAAQGVTAALAKLADDQVAQAAQRELIHNGIAALGPQSDGVKQSLSGVAAAVEAVRSDLNAMGEKLATPPAEDPDAPAEPAAPIDVDALKNDLQEFLHVALRELGEGAFAAPAEKLSSAAQHVAEVFKGAMADRTAQETLQKRIEAALEGLAPAASEIQGAAEKVDAVAARIEAVDLTPPPPAGPVSFKIDAGAVSEQVAEHLRGALEDGLRPHADAMSAAAAKIEAVDLTPPPAAPAAFQIDAGAVSEQLAEKLRPALSDEIRPHCEAVQQASAEIAGAISGAMGKVDGLVDGLAPAGAALTGAVDKLAALSDAPAAAPEIDAEAVADQIARQLSERLGPQTDALAAATAEIGDAVKRAVGDRAAQEAIRERVERLLAAFGPVSQQLVGAAEKIDALAAPADADAPSIDADALADQVSERLVSALSDQASAAFGPHAEAFAAASARVDDAIKRAVGDRAAQEAIRERIERLLGAFGPMSQQMTAAIERLDQPQPEAAAAAPEIDAEAMADRLAEALGDKLAGAITPHAEAFAAASAQVDDAIKRAVGDRAAQEAIRERIERLLGAFGPMSQQMTAAIERLDQPQPEAAAAAPELDAEAMAERLAEALGDKLAGAITPHAEAFAAASGQVDDAIKRAVGDRAAQEAIRERIERLLGAFGPMSQQMTAALERIEGADPASAPASGAAEIDADAVAERISAVLTDRVAAEFRPHAESFAAAAAQADETIKRTIGDRAAQDGVRQRVEGLLAAFGPVSQSINQQLIEIRAALASGAVGAGVEDGAAEDSAAEDSAAEDAADAGAPPATLPALGADFTETLAANAEATAAVAARLEDVMRAISGDTRAAEGLRRRIERLLAAFGGVTANVATMVERLGPMTPAAEAGGAPAIGGFDEAAAEQMTEKMAEVSDKIDSISAAINEIRGGETFSEVSEGLEAHREALETMLGKLDAQITHNAGMVAAQEGVRRRVDTLFQVSKKLVRSLGRAEAAADAPAEPGAELAPMSAADIAQAATGGVIETAAAPAPNRQEPFFQAAEMTTMRVAVGFRALFRRLADVVDRFEAAADNLPDAMAAERPDRGAKGARAAATAAIAELCRRVEVLSSTLLSERERILEAAATDIAPSEVERFNMRLARLEASALEVSRHKEEFLSIAAATTRAIDSDARSGPAVEDAAEAAAEQVETADQGADDAATAEAEADEAETAEAEADEAETAEAEADEAETAEADADEAETAEAEAYEAETAEAEVDEAETAEAEVDEAETAEAEADEAETAEAEADEAETAEAEAEEAETAEAEPEEAETAEAEAEEAETAEAEADEAETAEAEADEAETAEAEADEAETADAEADEAETAEAEADEAETAEAEADEAETAEAEADEVETAEAEADEAETAEAEADEAETAEAEADEAEAAGAQDTADAPAAEPVEAAPASALKPMRRGLL